MTKDKKTGDSNDLWWRPALILFFQLSGWIAFPVIGAIFIGQWLDKKYGTDPWLYLAAVGVAFVISTFGIVREAGAAIKQMEEFNKKEKKDDK
ncbi:MAG: AtpZ/AtpI family protein [Patescibacteria group bacterium]|jgi:F0F1-type ATP synthase assembly protein I